MNRAMDQAGNQLEYEVRRTTQKLPVVDLTGVIDVETVSVLRNVLTGLMEQGETRLLINLSQVNYLDSTGLALLVWVLNRVRERSGDAVLINPNPQVIRVINLSHLDRIFPICSIEEEAIEVIQRPRQ